MRPLVTLLAGMALMVAPANGETLGYWRFDGDLTCDGAPGLGGDAGIFEKGTRPVFDAAAPSSNIWNGATSSIANPGNRGSLRFPNEAASGAGSPIGGEVTVSASEAKAHPASLTVEAFVRMVRQMPRHALVASQRRNGQTGATWSLSIDPEGRVRARFDTQPDAEAKGGGGFNQSFGSTASVADGAWHHVALTFDHATRSAAIYVDHARCGGGITTGPLVYDTSPLVFGRGLDGWLDEVRLSAEALHPEQFLRERQFFSDINPRAPTAAMLDQTPTRVQTGLKIEWPKVGTLKPKSVKENETPMWSLGCETLDRDLADWDTYKEYLGPLGIRHIRLQGGWGRTEKEKGVYDFGWLDRIVDDAHSRGLAVCLETSYGNRLYEPKAALGPGGRLPEGKETMAAWDKWVEAMARRYSARGVSEWMMYNEPNLTRSNTVERTTAFNIRTAQTIKRVDPNARIAGLVSAGADPGFVGGFLRGLKEQGKLGLFDWVVYHHYSANPDATYGKVEALQALLREHAPNLRLWQGEAGCASEEVQFALGGIDWTEVSHAKWNMRRMLGDLGRDIRSSVFTISDLSYHKDFISRYGLLKTDEGNSIIRVKTAYYAVQNIVSVFNGSVRRVPDYAMEIEDTTNLCWHAYRDKATGLDLVTFWDGTDVPRHDCATAKARMIMRNAHFKEPVWVDLLTGNLHAIPVECTTAEGGIHTFRDVPVYDGPTMIADKSLLSFVPARQKKRTEQPAITNRKRPVAAPAADAGTLMLNGGKGELVVDARGISLAPTIAACPAINAKDEPLWAVLVQPDVAPPVPGEPFVLTDKGQAVTRAKTADGIRISCDALTDGKQTWRIGVTIDIRRKGDAFEVTGEVRNDEKGWIVCGFTGPVLHGIRADLTTHPVLLPDGFGRRLDRAPAGGKPAPWKASGEGFEIAAHYPGRRGTMQWCAFAGQRGGLYLGCHDAAHGAKSFCVRYDPASRAYGLAMKHQTFCPAGRRWALPPTVLLPYEDTWHAAARHYRKWADTVAPMLEPPAWTRDASGWLLCILKQQNGEVLWDYASLGKLCDVADARGLDILGLFGWAHGGHDHLYPDYFPDPKMGGENALRKALKEARDRGKRTILYANGQLQEIGTEFWEKQGRDLTVIGRDGMPVRQTYHKYRNAPPRHFGLGCLVTQGWYDCMLELAVQANDLGADGILYDQLGIFEPMPCYAANHGHPAPSVVYAADRVLFMRRIAEHMRAIDPDFVVMTEGLHDSVLDSISMFHGCTLGTFEVTSAEISARLNRTDAAAVFPEMFRYTFPESISTIRMPTPMMGRAMANYTCAYGFRFEIESRYAPDVLYLRENMVPDAAQYGDVINKPNIALMQSVPPDEATRYLGQAIAFQRTNADLLWRGRFVDDEGFAFRGDGLVAKGFSAGARLGVVVWNPGDKPAPFTLEVPGAALVSASDPEHGKVDAFGDLPPQSIRLLVWRQK